MTLGQLGLVLLAQAAQVAGQILLKKGMTRTAGRVSLVAAGTAMLTFWFLAWLKLLQGLDISYLYPFEGLSLVLLVLASSLFLGEKMHRSAWIGMALIATGMVLVGLN
ncbi:MAG: EamA family transporter [Planctomycetaceae bacterium]|nr:EamA family transporter [Planctomycetaceae bacterium]